MTLNEYFIMHGLLIDILYIYRYVANPLIRGTTVVPEAFDAVTRDLFIYFKIYRSIYKSVAGQLIRGETVMPEAFDAVTRDFFNYI